MTRRCAWARHDILSCARGVAPQIDPPQALGACPSNSPAARAPDVSVPTLAPVWDSRFDRFAQTFLSGSDRL